MISYYFRCTTYISSPKDYISSVSRIIMAQVVVTRRFRLNDLKFDDDLFVQYRAMVNDQIQQGIQLPYAVFERDSLVAVKKFYRQLSKYPCDLRERVHRCGSQYSYCALRGYRRNQKNLTEIFDNSELI